MPQRNPTRSVAIGNVMIGDGHPIVIQSMCAVKTTDVVAAVEQVELLQKAGAGIVRLAVDSRRDAEALAEIRKRTDATLSVDLQENYRVASEIAPVCDKIRYNPGHLHHAEAERSWQDKVRFSGPDGGGARLCDSGWRELRVGRSGDEGAVSVGRFAGPHGCQCGGARRVSGDDRLHAVLRVAEGFGSGVGNGGESAVRVGEAAGCRSIWA